MRDFARSLYLLFLFGFFADVCAQGFDTAQRPLPPEIMSDRYLVKAELLEANKDFASAFDVMEKVIALSLYKAHDLKLPVDFHFKYARVALAADSIRIAYDSVNLYLTTAGREGEFYREALLLSLEAEEELAEVEILPEDTCAEKSDKGNCWMPLADRTDCYVWSYGYGHTTVSDRPLKWSGRCKGNVGRGEGTLTFSKSGWVGYTIKGTLQRGKWHGKCVETTEHGSVSTGRYANGNRHGHWIEHSARNHKKKGEYIDGKREGTWLQMWNESCSSITYRQGEEAASWQVDMSRCEGW